MKVSLLYIWPASYCNLQPDVIASSSSRTSSISLLFLVGLVSTVTKGSVWVQSQSLRSMDVLHSVQNTFSCPRRIKNRRKCFKCIFTGFSTTNSHEQSYSKLLSIDTEPQNIHFLLARNMILILSLRKPLHALPKMCGSSDPGSDP